MPPIADCDLEDVIATAELDRRPKRPRDAKAESSALLSLTSLLAESPQSFFQQLVIKALELSGAGSTGISLLNEEERRFVWPAIAGKLQSFLGSGTPSDFGPCGTVIERGLPLLFVRPQRHFKYMESLDPPLEEVLLIPFSVDGKIVGTIWAVMHDPARKFDAEDRRLLTSLSVFASSAYRLLVNLGALEPLLNMRPVN